MNWEKAKIAIGYAIGTAAFLASLYFAWLGPNYVLQMMLCLGGGSAGWLVGIFITPLDEGEKKQFSDYAKGVSALVSGFAIAKLEGWLTPLSERATQDAELLLTRSLLFFVCFFVALLFTFIGRRYIHAPEAERREKREKHLKEAQEALTKLAGLQ